MKNYNRFIFLIIVSLFLVNSQLTAQSFNVGVNLIAGSPQDEFDDNINNPGFGIGGLFGYHPGASPLMVGAEFSFLIYGIENRQEPFSTTIPDVTVDVETSNYIFLGHLFARLQSNQGFIRPYLEGLIGFHHLFTETEISNEGVFEEPIAKSTNLNDTAFSYGTGGGVMILVHKSKKQSERDRLDLDEVLINFRLRYLFGGEADYLKKGSIGRENGEVTYDINHSRTNLLTFQLGVAFIF